MTVNMSGWVFIWFLGSFLWCLHLAGFHYFLLPSWWGEEEQLTLHPVPSSTTPFAVCRILQGPPPGCLALSLSSPCTFYAIFVCISCLSSITKSILPATNLITGGHRSVSNSPSPTTSASSLFCLTLIHSWTFDPDVPQAWLMRW